MLLRRSAVMKIPIFVLTRINPPAIRQYYFETINKSLSKNKCTSSIVNTWMAVPYNLPFSEGNVSKGGFSGSTSQEMGTES
jgi:hypothetical protein